MSHPSRVRGLKCASQKACVVGAGVAPFTGAWIEIGSDAGYRMRPTSHPSRVRGLKCRHALSRRPRRQESHPSRVRGLKYLLQHVMDAEFKRRTLHGCVD